MKKNQNVIWAHTGVSRKQREKRNGHKAVVIWLTGLPCSGKSTIAKNLQQELFRCGRQVYVLDGDNVRHGLNAGLGFSAEDRRENIRRIGEVAKLFLEAGLIVITAFISPYRRDRRKARSLFARGDFVEVYVKADLSVCEKRDIKGLYKKAREGTIKNFTGISAPYEVPYTPELIIDTQRQTIPQSVTSILKYLEASSYLKINSPRL